MSVRGNGLKTVAELITHEFQTQQRRPPWRRTKIRPLDTLAHEAMAAAGVSASSVPAEGALVPLRRIELTDWGGVAEEVTNRVHPENLRIALEAATLFNLHVAGIDIISSDISMPWYENGAIIVKVSFSPLLGGSDISRRYLPLFIEGLMDGDGRIPVEVFIGGDAAWQAARQRWQTLLSKDVDAYLTNAVQTISPSGRHWIMPGASVYQRARALALSAKVGGIVLVVQTDEFLFSGLPFEAVDAFTKVDDHLASYKTPGGQIPVHHLATLYQLLGRWS